MVDKTIDLAQPGDDHIFGIYVDHDAGAVILKSTFEIMLPFQVFREHVEAGLVGESLTNTIKSRVVCDLDDCGASSIDEAIPRVLKAIEEGKT